MGFQSTRPVWGATCYLVNAAGERRHFNPRAPCGARQAQASNRRAAAAFQSTRPVWGATTHDLAPVRRFCISIHAPRVGRDFLTQTLLWRFDYFNPRAPCGARRLVALDQRRDAPISIHAPRVGRDEMPMAGVPKSENFNPRAPCGARPLLVLVTRLDTDISIHAPRVGRDHLRVS